jgi:hypothetical protein
MAIRGVDYSSGYGPHLPGALVAGGYRFAMRYLSHPGNPKNLTAAELKALHAAGLGVGLVFETTAERPLKGKPAGKDDAEAAKEQVAALGLTDAAVYFAADFDASGHQLDTTVAYLRAAAAVLGHDRTGVYGGIAVVDACAAAAGCTYFWQTSAWSGGRVSPAAHLYQHQYDLKVGGARVDVNDLLDPPAGIDWPHGAPTIQVELHLGDTGGGVPG